MRITAPAQQDIDSILRWFDERLSTAAQRWFQQLTIAMAALEVTPERCPIANVSAEIGIAIRELLVGRKQNKYRILFQIRQSNVHVLRIWHAARDAFSTEDN